MTEEGSDVDDRELKKATDRRQLLLLFCHVPSYQTPCAISIGVAPSKNIKLSEGYQQLQNNR